MMSNFLKLEIQNSFIKITGINGIITLAKSLITIISTKIVALIVGSAGIAMIGQLQNFITISTLISSGGFNQGLTRYIAENKEDKKEISGFIGTAFVTTAILTLLTGLLILWFPKYLSLKIFTQSSYFSILIVFALLMFFYNLNSIIIAVVNGFQNYRLYFKINIVTTIAGFLLTIALVVNLKEYGALLALILAQSGVFFITYWLVRNEKWITTFRYRFFDKVKLNMLLKYTAITLFAAIIWPIVNIVIRTYVINNISLQEAGIWQATRNINDYIVNIAIGSFAVYLLPKLASIKDKSILKIELIKIYKTIVPITIIGFVVIYILRDFIVLILYSQEFSRVGDYLLLQMVGSFFWMCKVPIMNYLLAKGLTKTYIINELSFAMLYIFLCTIFIPLYKVQGIQLSFAIYNFLYLIINIFLIRKYLIN